GNAVMVGMGGTLVEVMNDVRFVYPPFGVKEAAESIKKLRCAKLLEGYRGKKGADIDALAEMMVSLGNMLCSLPDIAEIDLNPLIYNEDKGAFITVDARVRRG
ncbi:MAG: acetate--CoA ligase family protein, partial [Firmicutes bacterium]|nr:acetate--CoA ligase family protein [Bacillota bacterium]